jgi:hypothetical protein
MRREGLSACGLGKELLDPDPVPLLKDQGGDREPVLRHLEGGAEGPRKSVAVPCGKGFELLQQGFDGGAIQGRIRRELGWLSGGPWGGYAWGVRFLVGR